MLLTLWAAPGGFGTDNTVRIQRTGAGTYRAILNENFASPVNSPAGVTSINVNTLDGNDIIIIESADVPITINGGNGSDTVRIGSFVSGTHTLSNISSTITLSDSPAGTGNTIELFDTGFLDPRTYTVDNTLVDNSFVTWTGTAGKVRWDGTYSRTTINVSNIAGLVGVNRLATNDDVRIVGGSGPDTLTVNPTTGLATALTGKIRFDGNGGNDVVNASDSGRSNVNLQTIGLRTDRITHSLSPNILTLGSNIETVNLTGSLFADQIELLSGPAARTVSVDANAGADSINVTPGTRELSNWQSPLSINGRNAAVVSLDDGFNPAARTFSITTASITSSGLPTISLSNVPTLDVIAGDSPDTFAVASNPADRTLRLYGNDSTDTFTLGGGINMTTLRGTINAYGDAGNDLIQFTDGLATNNITFTFTRDSISQTGFARSATNVSGFFQGIESVDLDAGSGNDTVNLNGVANNVSVSISGNNGNDTFNLGGGNLDANLPGGATVNGDGGSDILSFNDQSDADTGIYTFDRTSSTNSTLRKSNMAVGIAFNSVGVEARVLNANNSPNSVFVRDTLTALTLNTSAGNDTITIEDAAVAVDIVSGSGDDDLLVNTDFATGGDTAASARIVADDHLYRLTVRRGGTLQLDASANLLVGSLVTTSIGAYDMTGTIDMGNRSSMILRNAGASATTTSVNIQARNGYVGGVWNGIDSTGTTGAIHSLFSTGSAAIDGVGVALGTDVAVASIGGFTLAANDVVVRHTLTGDADLDLAVGFSDLLRVAQNYNSNARIWGTGNFDYDVPGNVGFGDLLVLAQNYGNSLVAVMADSSAKKRQSPVRQVL